MFFYKVYLWIRSGCNPSYSELCLDVVIIIMLMTWCVCCSTQSRLCYIISEGVHVCCSHVIVDDRRQPVLSDTVIHGLCRTDLQLPLLFVSSCLAYFHKQQHTHLFSSSFPLKRKKQSGKWRGSWTLGVREEEWWSLTTRTIATTMATPKRADEQYSHESSNNKMQLWLTLP